ncbi:fumarylacetoacetate hydrolase [Hyaloraphidium curvatum]|nr:fumarylacetoacetate hydrolase [Hyaloraphidium curvatum]
MATDDDYHDSGIRPASSLRSWHAVPASSDFPIQNVPWGVGTFPDGAKHICTRIGDTVLSMRLLTASESPANPFRGHADLVAAFAGDALNAFMGLGKAKWRQARQIVQDLLKEGASAEVQAYVKACGVDAKDVKMGLPCVIGDYTDFYASKEHATNAGIILRGKDNALQPNWLHIPVAYHGRSSSVVPSGTPIVRPRGQVKGPEGVKVVKCEKFDYELEMAYLIGGPANELGAPLPVATAAENVFGLVILNDWSARDIQAWEYVPLGPFLGKNFGSTISCWVVSEAALEPWLVPMAEPEVPVQKYLDGGPETRKMWDVKVECLMKADGASELTPLTHTSLRHLYWSPAQFLAHHTVNGCPLRPGDLLGTGTISAPSQSPLSFGSLLEKSWNGTKPFPVAGGGERTWLKDGDEVVMRAWCEGDGYRVGFGECAGVVKPALDL